MLIYSMSEPNTTLITSHTIRINILLSVRRIYGFEMVLSILYFTAVVLGASISFYGGEKVAHSILLFGILQGPVALPSLTSLGMSREEVSM